MSNEKVDYHDRSLGRREMLYLTGAAALAPLTAPLSTSPKTSNLQSRAFFGFVPVSGPGYVVRIHMPGMRGRFSPHPEAARMMVDRAVVTLAGTETVKAAWERLFYPGDRVGIKVNLTGGRLSGTSREVVDAVVDGLLSVTIPPENIMVFNESATALEAAGFTRNNAPKSIRVVSTDDLGFDKKRVEVHGARVRFAKILTANTAIINLPVLTDHEITGVAGALKNLVLGTVDFRTAADRHNGDILTCLYGHEAICGRVRLTVTDGSFCLFDGGPRHNPKAHVTHDSIYAASDPVALDRIAQEVIDDLRLKNGLKSLTESGRPAKYLEAAADLGLGIADRNAIHLETVNLPRFSGSAA